MANADFVIVGDASAEEAAQRFPAHALIGTVERASGNVQILRTRAKATKPYRLLYAQEFLRRRPDLEEDEARVVAREMLIASVLGRHHELSRELLRRRPDLADPDFAARNIYWIGGYQQILRLGRIEPPRRLVR